YGLPGLQVDGNHALAVYAASREAVERARADGGPTLIECVTYRLGVHTTADDPTKYRSDEEVRAWERKDPLTRFHAYLEKKNLLEQGVDEQVDQQVARGVEAFESAAAADPLGMFEHAYGEPTPDLLAERAELEGRVRETPGRSAGGGAAAAAAADARAAREEPMAKLNMVKALNLALHQEMARDPDVLVIGEDVGVDGGVFRVTEDLHRAFGGTRVIDS